MSELGRPGRTILSALSLYAGLVALGVVLWREPVLLASLYLMVSILVLVVWKEASVRVMYLAAAMLGPAAEYLAVWAGAWSYAEAPLGLPIWLPFAWGLTGSVFLKISRTFAF